MMEIFVGAAVGSLLSEVLLLVKKVRRGRESLRKLEWTLSRISPHIENLKDRGNDNYLAWLTRLNNLLIEIKLFIKKYCVLEGKSWRSNGCAYLRLPFISSRIMDFDDQIRKEILFSTLINLDVNQETHDNHQTYIVEKGEAVIEFIPRVLPPNIVKFETDPFQKLKTLIMNESNLSSDPTIFGLEGHGGIGKTFLAKMLHNDEDIKAKFGVGSIFWITVGNDAKLCELYKAMGVCFNSNAYGIGDFEQQQYRLIEVLRGKKILLILDDVWERDEHGQPMMHWLDVAKGKGSITLVTTRQQT